MKFIWICTIIVAQIAKDQLGQDIFLDDRAIPAKCLGESEGTRRQIWKCFLQYVETSSDRETL